MDLNWIEIGNLKSEETMVFLHEGLGCIELWKDYPQLLCKKLNIRGVVYDRAGYGKSPGSLTDRKADYLHLAAIELESLLDKLKIKSVHLYGHSDGGSIALIFASKYPELAKSVITEAAHVFNENETISGVKAARPLLKQGKMEGLKKYHGNRYKEVFNAWNNIWLDNTFRDWNIEHEVSAVHCPSLIIQGRDDQYGTLKQVYAIEKAIKGATMTLIPYNCGHAPFKEQQEVVIENVINFYNEYF